MPSDPADAYDDEFADPDDWACTHCGGEGYAECIDPLQCMAPSHIGNDFDLWCPCTACGGSGKGKDQVVW